MNIENERYLFTLEELDHILEREKKIVSGLKSMLGIKVDVKVVEPKTITRSEGKAVRVIDKRHLYQ